MRLSIILVALAALVLLFLKSREDETSDSNVSSQIEIPDLAAPVTTNAPAHWMGRDFSGNMNIDSLGGVGGTW